MITSRILIKTTDQKAGFKVAPFRQSKYNTLQYKQRQQVQDVFLKFLKMDIDANDVLDDIDLLEYEGNRSSFWKMVLITKTLVCSPPGSLEDKRYSHMVENCIELLIDGNINQLYNKAYGHEQKHPPTTIASINIRKKSFLETMNNDNICKASNMLNEPLPTVPYNVKTWRN